MLKTLLIGLVATMGFAATASAQVPTDAEAEQIKARQKVFMMEGVLERAVQLGVDNLRRRVRAVMPDDALLQGGPPQVRGFRLDGYGVFFDVEVPALRRSLAWSIRTMNETALALARDVARMKAFVQAIADPMVRAEFDRTLQRIQRQMGPPVAAGGTPAHGPAPVAARQSLAGSPDPDGADAPDVDTVLLTDPSEAYTQEVKAALIEAMIENSGPLVVAPDEWLTIAARDNAPADPFMPGDQGAMTLILRVRGSDLNAFRAGRLTLDETRARVEASEF